MLSRYLNHPVLLLDDGGRVRWHTAGNGEKAMPLAEIRIDLPRQQDASSHQSVEVKLGDTLHLGALTRFGQQFFCILADQTDELPWDTIDHALRIITLSQRGHEERPLDLNNYYEPLFQFLIDGKGKTDTEIVQLCDYYAFPYRLNRVCVLIAPREKEKGFEIHGIGKACTACPQKMRDAGQLHRLQPLACLPVSIWQGRGTLCPCTHFCSAAVIRKPTALSWGPVPAAGI